MISSKASSCSRSMVLLVASTITYGLPSTATTHRRIASCSRRALSSYSYSYSTSSYSSGVGIGGDDDDDDGGVGVDDDDDDDDDVGEQEDDYEDDDDEEEDDGIDEMDMPTTKKHAIWTDDLVREHVS